MLKKKIHVPGISHISHQEIFVQINRLLSNLGKLYIYSQVACNTWNESKYTEK